MNGTFAFIPEGELSDPPTAAEIDAAIREYGLPCNVVVEWK